MISSSFPLAKNISESGCALEGNFVLAPNNAEFNLACFCKTKTGIVDGLMHGCKMENLKISKFAEPLY